MFFQTHPFADLGQLKSFELKSVIEIPIFHDFSTLQGNPPMRIDSVRFLVSQATWAKPTGNWMNLMNQWTNCEELHLRISGQLNQQISPSHVKQILRNICKAPRGIKLCHSHPDNLVWKKVYSTCNHPLAWHYNWLGQEAQVEKEHPPC